ncbi:hypothetical protein CLIM01_02060 [Colletotrichum limetticola]|uniref:Uncharacterized protein n=1 Tax=Colletotrichum limetticola TaxID=1209924 RepID=A0ABQ9Q9T2_9PEZI|nr:hypothetical protein CLIM01_02060 [Colletotrichum limetticola]
MRRRSTRCRVSASFQPWIGAAVLETAEAAGHQIPGP